MKTTHSSETGWTQFHDDFRPSPAATASSILTTRKGSPTGPATARSNLQVLNPLRRQQHDACTSATMAPMRHRPAQGLRRAKPGSPPPRRRPAADPGVVERSTSGAAVAGVERRLTAGTLRWCPPVRYRSNTLTLCAGFRSPWWRRPSSPPPRRPRTACRSPRPKNRAD